MGRIIIIMAFLMSFAGYSQVASMTISSVDYQFVGDSFSEFRNGSNPRGVDVDDLNTYLVAFVQDAIAAGHNLDLTNNTGNVLLNLGGGRTATAALNSINFVSDEFYTGSETQTTDIGGSSWGSTHPGYVITINERVWNSITYARKLALAYHELAHALVHFDHVCERSGNVFAIMATGACERFSAPSSKYYFYNYHRGYVNGAYKGGLIDHLFEQYVLLPASPRGTSSKGGAYEPIHD